MTSGNPKTERPDPQDLASDPLHADPDRPFFAALLTPYRSLGPEGFRILMLVVCAICLSAGLLFLSLGAWPVFGFLGLDILLIFFAFRWNYRAARAYEEVQVSRTEIRIRKVLASGREQLYSCNPFWARLHVREEEDEGVVRITLTARDMSVDIGGFLNPEDRTSFAGALRQAVALAQAGGPRPDLPATA
ncbi:DUF2244 domain-containing protein [Stappia sp. 28M-7]|jgi:uncharacterized membrane protein|uniref:DUF2244 domain-containing protein n=1 Tax=Stappia sp. 28M-7 TaxID=2762596 RepID=UPI000E76D01B|nr:DUF2244 domain-containing protein [Stappia sp. 28M-7]MBC2861573.1 DUF2244 domain-containing protein [Stappia sp. 28M-7]